MNKGDKIVIETVENLLTTLEEHSSGKYLDSNEYGAGTFISMDENEIVYYDPDADWTYHVNRKYVIWWGEGDKGEYFEDKVKENQNIDAIGVYEKLPLRTILNGIVVKDQLRINNEQDAFTMNVLDAKNRVTIRIFKDNFQDFIDELYRVVIE